LIECKTYRYMGHYVGDPLTYRSKEEAEDWRQNRDPLDRFEKDSIEMSLVDSDDLRRIDAAVEALLEKAVQEAEAAPYPDPEDVLADVYSTS